MRQVHFAFRPVGDGWTGGHTTYEVRASVQGFSVAPATSERTGAPATFTPVFLGRASAPAGALGGAGQVQQDGHLTVRRGEATEHLQNGEQGVEQRFSFESRPEGSGDLVVRQRVSGQVYAGKTELGHHFVDAATELGVRYGLAMWIDGRGEQTPVEVTWSEDAGELALTVPAAVVDSSVYPAVLDPVISPEYGMDTPILGYARGAQSWPSIAYGGGSYLVTWCDERIADYHYYGALISTTGALVTPGGIRLSNFSTSSCTSARTAAAFDGTNFLVVWQDIDFSGSWSHIRATRVSTSGLVLETFALSSGSLAKSDPAISFDGANYLVVWQQSATIRYARVSPAGYVLDPGGINVIGNGGNEYTPSVAFDGTNHLIAWREGNSSANQIRAARISPAGVVLDPAGFVVADSSGSKYEPSVAFDGTNFFVTWQDTRSGSWDIYGARVTPGAVVLDPTGIPLIEAQGTQELPNIVWNGAAYLLTWADFRSGSWEVYAARVHPAGVVLDPGGFPVPAGPHSQWSPTAACEGQTCLVACGSGEIFGARIDATGAVLDPAGILISAVANEQSNPAVASGNTGYLVVWEDARTGTATDIYGVRVAANGDVLDPSGITISTANNSQKSAAVAWNGSTYLVAWSEYHAPSWDIYGARVDANGTVLDPAGIPISTYSYDQQSPSIASDGSGHLVVWSDERAGVGADAVYGARVEVDGTVLDPSGISIGAAGGADLQPQVAYGGGQYLVVWAATQLRANRVTPAGAVLDGPSGFTFNSGTPSAPALAFDGVNFLTVYQRNGQDVWGARISGAGTVLDLAGFPIANASTYAEGDPAVAFNGSDYLVVWTDQRLGPSESAIYGTWMTGDGSVATPGGLFLAGLVGSRHGAPALAANGADHALLVYHRLHIGDEAMQSYRVHARFITALASGHACSSADECASGICVDGVCCATACGNGASDDCLACSVSAGAAADGTCTPLSGVPCIDGDACTQVDTCQAGVCTGSDSVTCAAQDACHLPGTCDPATGLCSNPARPDGEDCDDGDACTQTDACQVGACVGTNPVQCMAPDDCHETSGCEPATGQCVVTQKPDGAACNDGDACTQLDACQAGACAGSNPVQCAAQDDCHLPGTCDPATGLCSNPAKPDGETCDDGSACTQTDACQAGACVGTNPVQCVAPDDCHETSGCDPATGQCIVTQRPDGAACNDGDGCTQTDACQGGACVGSNPVQCAAPDDCHLPGTCDPATGLCSNPAKPDGESCDDGNACTQTDICQAGACDGSAPVACTPPDDCHTAECDPATGACVIDEQPDGSPCSGGHCMDGACQEGSGGAGGASSSTTGGGGSASTSSTGAGSSGEDAGDSEDSGGCGCRTASSGASGAPALLAIALLAGVGRWRRSSRSGAHRRSWRESVYARRLRRP